MKYFSFDDIRAAADCREIAAELFDAKISGGRCAAVWRGGKNPNSVAIDKDRWYDHGAKTGGGAIELAKIHFDDIHSAQQWLGEYYHLAPEQKTGPQPVSCRYENLKRQGYTETARWYYKEMDGSVRHFEVRLDHPDPGKKKEYCQGTPKGWGLRGIDPMLYNLRGIVESDWCCIVEGPKCAQCLIDQGIPATTCCGGAKKWIAEYTKPLKGKKVVIMPDNDEAGADHATLVASSLYGIAKEIRIVKTSDKPKGDVYDYLTTEGHTLDDLFNLIQQAPEYIPDRLTGEAPDADPYAIEVAKTANRKPFRNYIPIKKEPDDKKSRRRKSEPKSEPKIDRKPRLIMDMIEDIHKRFLGFPRKVGEQLFDHDRETGRIFYINKPMDLFAWIQRKSKHVTSWARGTDFTTKEEILAGLAAEATRYEAISYVPDWPQRNDVYYAHKKLPPACPMKSRFNSLVDAFAPATPEDKTFLRALICAPLWYRYGIPKPSWVIDSEDGPGTGKSTIVEVIAHLYCGEPIRTNRQELRYGIQELIKRAISSHGRQQRLLMIDNITGSFSCPELADMITAGAISGRAPYGRGEETRPNNLVYVITANTAVLDTDLADRSFFINVRRPKRDAEWKSRLLRFIEENRFKIIADIISMLEEDHFTASVQTRFPEFETSILQAVCAGEEEYESAITHWQARRSESNIEDEHSRIINDTIREQLADLNIHPDQNAVFLRTQVIEHWLKDAISSDSYIGNLPQYVRNLAKMGLLPEISPKIKRYPMNGNNRRSGFMWHKDSENSVITLALNSKKQSVEKVYE